MTTLIICIIIAVLVLIHAAIAMSAQNDPCRNCPCEYCHECEYWRDAVIGGGMLLDDEGIPTQDMEEDYA